MASVLSTSQGLLTRAGNRLKAILEENADLLSVELNSSSSSDEQQRRFKDLRRRIRRATAVIEAEAGKLEDALYKYSNTSDALDENPPSISELSKRIADHSEAAQLLIDRAHEALSTLMKLQADIECSTDSREADMLDTKLAPIPIPKFKGDIWEWNTFWTSFNHNVHSRNIDDLYKLNYLLEALQGDALESAKQFEVSGTTYSLVIAHLKQKYGNKQALVECLLRKLQSAKSRSTRLVDQETLCEQLFSIVSQLKLKNEHVDNTFLQKQLLAKFSVDVQRHILREKARYDEEEWNTMKLLSSAQEFIKEELQIIKQTESRQDNRERQEQGDTTTTRISNKGQRLPPCFYCRKMGHLPKHCSEVSTRDQRLHIMKTRKLCHNCGANDHMATSCPRGACRACGIAGHHTSICRKLFETQEAPRLPQTTNQVDQAVDDQPTSDTVLHVNDNADVMILAGQAQVLNPVTAALETVYVMLDTGADRSFISNELAARLQLKDVDSKRLTISTFGTRPPMVETCGITVLKMWNVNGSPHTFTVTRIDKVTDALQRNSLCLEDKRFLCDNDLQLSISPLSRDIRPQVLLGCADLFSLLCNGLAPQHVLPSGLQLIPSKLGYLMAGRTSNDYGNDDDIDTTTVCTLQASTDADSLQSWEDFCTFESSGVEEFVGPQTKERKLTDAAVWKEFEKTIERKQDGYYVRLPWRKEVAQLPDNKGLAVRRLQTLVARMGTDQAVVQQYRNTIQDQLNQGIIEEVDEARRPDGDVVHYLAHRAVITPHKTTTKLRIVFDASAHLKDSPSLNDALHRGPVMLPKLCDILLRFRIGDVAVTSDVEKAFLQVRLHLQDRDPISLAEGSKFASDSKQHGHVSIQPRHVRAHLLTVSPCWDDKAPPGKLHSKQTNRPRDRGEHLRGQCRQPNQRRTQSTSTGSPKHSSRT